MADDGKRELPWPLLAGAGIVGLILVVLILLSGEKPRPAVVAEKLPFGEEEKAYAKQVRFDNLKVSRAANFLNQEVTFLFGDMSNEGSRGIAAIEVILEFRDPYGQVVLRDPRSLMTRTAPPVGPGQTREFQISFEHVPVDWDQRAPVIRVTGLRLR
jgi:hypothetical protein